MEQLLVYLTAIASLAKDLHYNMYGSNFYGNHLLMDRVYDGIYDFIDEIKENYYMYYQVQIPSDAAVVFPQVIDLLKKSGDEISEKISALIEWMQDVIYICDDLSNGKTQDCGDTDLLGRISVKMKNGVALVRKITAT